MSSTRNVSLTDHLDLFVEEQVKSGAYQNASEVVRDALRVLEAQKQAHTARVERLRTAVQDGADDLARGDFVGLNSEMEIAAHLRKLDDPA